MYKEKNGQHTLRWIHEYIGVVCLCEWMADALINVQMDGQMDREMNG